MGDNLNLRGQTLDTIQSFINDGIIYEQDLMRFKQSKQTDMTDPEYLRLDMENWYKALGVEYITNDKFSLSLPYFTKEEIQEAYDNNEIIMCVPKGLSKKQLGKLFNFDSWALEDNLITDTREIEDFWFKMKKTFLPEHLDKKGVEIKRIYQKENKLGMSLERYMVFIARLRFLTSETPDVNHKVWITRGYYEGKAMLIAGFDSNGKFSVHGWLKNFNSPYVGGRYVIIPDHLYI